MRENRLAKLAEMRKVADVELSDAAKINGQTSEHNEGFYETVGGTVLYCDKDKRWFLAADSRGKITGRAPSEFTPLGENESYKITTGLASSVAKNKFQNILSKAQAESAVYYEAEADKAQAKKVQSPSGAQQGTRPPINPTPIKHPVGTKLKDASYEYEVMDKDGSFEWINLIDRSKHGTFSLSQSGPAKWNKAVSRLNDPNLTTVISPSTTAPVAATPPPAPVATPAATPAATTAETAVTGLDQSLVQKVAAVLQKAEYTPLNIESGSNEMGQIKSLKSAVGGLIQLAAIIVLRVGDSLTTLPAAKSSDITSGTRKDLAVNMGGRFASDVGIILRQVNEITKIRNQSKLEFQKLVNSVRITRGTQAPVTTATPAAAAPATPPTTTPETPETPETPAAADDGQNKSASLNKKFIKAATLRRLKIRSQMEAAIDSSAQMGRARVS